MTLKLYPRIRLLAARSRGVRTASVPEDNRRKVNMAAFIATHSNSIDERPFERRRHVGVDYDKIERTASIGVSDLLPIGLTGAGNQNAERPKSVPSLSSAAPSNTASRDFFGSDRRTNTTRWTPGPAIPAVAPK